MIIFRSDKPGYDWKLGVAYALLLIGALGFFGCWIIGWNTEMRVFSDAIFSMPSEMRTDAIEVKGKIYFVEPNYGWYFRMSDRLILVSFAIGGLGGGYVEHRKRKSKYPWS